MGIKFSIKLNGIRHAVHNADDSFVQVRLTDFSFQLTVGGMGTGVV